MARADGRRVGLTRTAVVGATDREGSVDRALVENLGAFEGEVVPVNPNRDRIFDAPGVDSLADAGRVDLAVPAPAGRQGLADAIRRVGQLATDFPRIAELDVNPLVVSPAGVCALDLRVAVEDA